MQSSQRYSIKLALSFLLLTLEIQMNGQYILGPGSGGAAKYDLNNKNLTINKNSWSETGLSMGFSTADQKNSRYYYIRRGFNLAVDTIVAINAITGDLISLETLPAGTVFANPVFYNDTLFGIDQYKGFSCYGLITKKYSVLNNAYLFDPNLGVQGTQSLDHVNKRYILFAPGLINRKDTIISFSMRPPFLIKKDTITTDFILAPKYFNNYLYGLDILGFRKINLLTRQSELLNQSFLGDGKKSFALTLDLKNNNLIVVLKSSYYTDSVISMSINSGAVVLKEAIPSKTLMEPQCFYGTISDLEKTEINTGIQLFPNPARAYFTVRSSSGYIKAIYIFNSQGQQMRHIEGIMCGIFEVNDLPPGFYSLIIETDRSVISEKIIVE